MNVIQVNDKTNVIKLDNVEYKPYDLNSLPKIFGCIEYGYRQYEDGKLVNAITLDEGISEWFNFKGLTYVRA